MFSSPVPVDQYSRVMVDLFDERDIISVSTGFLSFFGAKESNSKTVFSDNSELIDIDIIRGNEKTAALISRGQLGTTDLDNQSASDQNFSSVSRKYPLGEEESTIRAHQLNKRLAGEGPYESQAKEDRLKVLANNNHVEHIRRFVRMFERLAAQSILTGKMDAILGTADANLQYDFLRNAENTFSVAVAWDQLAATPMSDIDDACDIGRKNGKTNMDMAVIGGEAMDALLSNASFLEKADNRRYELIKISSTNPVPEKFARFVKGGFTARGRLITPKGYELWLFSYVDGYTDSADNFVKYMPEDKMLIASSTARCDRYFGPSEIMPMNQARLDLMASTFGIQNPETMEKPEIKGEGTVIPEMFHYDSYPHHGGKGVVSRTQTAPIFATTQTDSFVLLEDLTTP